MSTGGRLSPIRRRRTGRAATALVAAAIGIGGLTACGNSAGPEAGAVPTQDLQEIEDDGGRLGHPPAELDVSDVVRVSGTVVRVQRDTFEQDFGIAVDELVDDPDVFDTVEGEVAVAADRIEVLRERTG